MITTLLYVVGGLIAFDILVTCTAVTYVFLDRMFLPPERALPYQPFINRKIFIESKLESLHGPSQNGSHP